jgi:CubicO group peptidase (beta-lactamase class C family)
VHLRGHGHARLDPAEAMTPDHLVAIGSTTKGMTALLALQQVGEGALALDAAARDVLPWFTAAGGAGHDITLRQLLSHQAGLPASAVFDGTTDDGALERRVRALADVPLARAPGSGFEYANDGYSVAGLMIQRSAGAPFETVMDERLFAPLGMRSTRFNGTDPAPDQAQGYLRQRGHTEARPLPLGRSAGPAGMVLSSARDVGRYLSALLLRNVPGVSEEAQREAWRPQVSLRDDMHYGLGWYLTRFGELDVVTHPGEILVSGSSFILVPRLGLGVAVLANLSTAAKDEIAQGVAMLALGQEPPPSQIRPERAPSTFEPDRSRWTGYVGDYASQQGVVRIAVEGDRLTGTVLGQSFELEPFSHEDFVARSGLPALEGADVAFRREEDGRLTLLVQGRPFATRAD